MPRTSRRPVDVICGTSTSRRSRTRLPTDTGRRADSRSWPRISSATPEGQDLGALRARLALARGDPQRALETIRDPSTPEQHAWWWFRLPAVIVYLDVHAMTGARDEVERVAERVLGAGNVLLHPFAERALGRVRGDAELIRRAADRFRALGLEARSQETAALL